MSFLPVAAFALSVAALTYFGFRDRAEYRRKAEEDRRLKYSAASDHDGPADSPKERTKATA